MELKTVDDLFAHALSDIYNAEQQFLGALEQMAPLATDKTLQKLLEQHHKQTGQQIKQLEGAFKALGTEPQSVTCATAAALIDEATKLIDSAKRAPGMIDYIIGSAQSKTEHFEIACYRSLLTTARYSGLDAVIPFLERNLQQEEQTAQELESSAPMLLEEGLNEQEMVG